MGRTRRRRRSLVVLVVAALSTVAGLAAPSAFPATSAAFTAVTVGTGNDVTAADIAPASGFAVTQTCSSVPAPAYRGSSSSSGVNTLTIPIPAGTAAGDVMLAQVMNRKHRHVDRSGRVDHHPSRHRRDRGPDLAALEGRDGQ